MSKPVQIFTAADFVGLTTNGFTRAEAEIAATRANEILNERGKRVYRCDKHLDPGSWGSTHLSLPCPDCTHEAVLIGEREIEK